MQSYLAKQALLQRPCFASDATLYAGGCTDFICRTTLSVHAVACFTSCIAYYAVQIQWMHLRVDHSLAVVFNDMIPSDIMLASDWSMTFCCSSIVLPARSVLSSSSCFLHRLCRKQLGCHPQSSLGGLALPLQGKIMMQKCLRRPRQVTHCWQGLLLLFARCVLHPLISDRSGALCVQT